MDKKKIKNKKWYLENKNYKIEKSKKWYLENKERAKLNAKLYEKKNKEKVKKYKKKWYLKNKDYVIQKSKNYYYKNICKNQYYSKPIITKTKRNTAQEQIKKNIELFLENMLKKYSLMNINYFQDNYCLLCNSNYIDVNEHKKKNKHKKNLKKYQLLEIKFYKEKNDIYNIYE